MKTKKVYIAEKYDSEIRHSWVFEDRESAEQFITKVNDKHNSTSRYSIREHIFTDKEVGDSQVIFVISKNASYRKGDINTPILAFTNYNKATEVYIKLKSEIELEDSVSYDLSQVVLDMTDL